MRTCIGAICGSNTNRRDNPTESKPAHISIYVCVPADNHLGIFREQGELKVMSNNTCHRRWMRGMASRRFLLVVAISTAALITAEAYAQSSASAQDQTASDSSDIKEIVV